MDSSSPAINPKVGSLPFANHAQNTGTVVTETLVLLFSSGAFLKTCFHNNMNSTKVQNPRHKMQVALLAEPKTPLEYYEH